MSVQFLESQEKQVMDEFAENGYIIFPLEEKTILEGLKKKVFDFAMASCDLNPQPTMDEFFNKTEKYIPLDRLNSIRVDIIKKINSDPDFRPEVYALAKKYIWWIVGSELAMQRTLNLSIQIPKDNSSLLPIHSDVWSGNSPYEIVFWLPFVDCYKTKSMFVLPLKKSEDIYRNFENVSSKSADGLLDVIRDDIIWLDVPYGHGVIFSHSILHGNIVNDEQETRWTMNVRFKSLLTPYGDKALGESFLPITVRPVTKIGYQYIKPRC